MAPTERAERPVWQLAYYAPLEETKGIKIFCDAVEQLPRTVLDRPGFEVRPSEDYRGPAPYTESYENSEWAVFYMYLHSCVLDWGQSVRLRLG